MLQKSGRLVLWEAMFILELHSAETQDFPKLPGMGRKPQVFLEKVSRLLYDKKVRRHGNPLFFQRESFASVFYNVYSKKGF